jgi:mono/diheme cytochrome c family protein
MNNIYKILLLMLFIISGAISQDVQKFYKQNCSSCHTIGGGRLTGPDLKNVHQRKDDDWIKGFSE